MKKSISWIMVICLSSVLVFSNFASAATSNPTYIGSTVESLLLVDSYIPPINSSDNPVGDYVIATYEGTFNLGVRCSNTDGYLSGYTSVSYVASPVIPSGSQQNGINIEGVDIPSNVFFSADGTSFRFHRVYDNDWANEYYSLGSVKVRVTISFTYTGSNIPDPYQQITCRLSQNWEYHSLSTYPEPQDAGLVHLIVTAINNGDFSNNIEELVDLLTLVKNNNATYYTNILAALNTENGWLEEIFTELDNWDQIWWPAIYEENQIQSSRLATVLSNLQTIISDLVLIDSNNVTWLTRLYNKVTDIYNYMQQSDQGATQAANAADQAAAQASQIAAVPRPNANAIINEGVSRIDTDISSGFSVLGAILNQQWYIWLLMIVISLAFVSYLMYGKGV